MKYLYFTSQYCVPCQAIKPRILKHSEIEIVDIDKQKELTGKYGIMSVPTIIGINGSNEPEYQVSGSRINKWLDDTFPRG